MKGLMLSTRKPDYVNYIFSLVEKDMKYVRTHPEEHNNLSPTEVFQSTMILDLEEFGMQHITHKPSKFHALPAKNSIEVFKYLSIETMILNVLRMTNVFQKKYFSSLL